MDKEKKKKPEPAPEVPEITENEPTTEAAPEVTNSELEQLRAQLTKTEEENGKLLRHLADYQNRHNEMQAVLRRSQQDIEAKLKFAHEKFAVELLSALDNLERAVDAAKQSGEKNPLIAGVVATQVQIVDVLKRYGITAIPAQGQPFDPNVHQAIQTVPAKEGEESNTVSAVVQNGYMIHDRVLRPAMVVVAQ
jgi:molecular chaperone GrpE